jgi:hypothetical protein
MEFEIKSLEKNNNRINPAQKNLLPHGCLLITTDAIKHTTTIVSGKTKKFNVLDRKKNI